MCATVVTFKTKHTVGGRKISFGHPDMPMPVIKTNLLHIMCGYQCDKAMTKSDTREVI